MAMIKYEHHGKDVWVDEALKGKHREHCLCWSCGKFTPGDRGNNCRIANVLYANCVAHDVVTPVWECPEYEAK